MTAEHLVLVSVDALRPEFWQDETWPAPTLQQLAWEGAVAREVRSVFPSLTYPAHTSMVTGVRPARHGIVHNRPFDRERQSDRWFWEARHIRAQTLWQAVKRAGGTVGMVAWPVTVGADVDWNVPDVWSPDGDADPVEVIRRATRPAGLLEELEREATGRLRPRNFTPSHLMREDKAGAMAAWIFERHQPTLLMLHLIGTDHIAHLHGRTNPLTRRAVAAADRAIGMVLETIDACGLRDRTAVVITGDHGVVDAHTRINVNRVLVDAGLMEPRPDRGRWRASFHASGGSAFLRLRDDHDHSAARLARAAVEALPRGVRCLFRCLERAELDALEADPAAPFALSAVPGVVLSDDAGAGTLVQATEGAAHGYLPDEPGLHTALVASGAGVHRGATAPIMRIEDVAPLLAALLGLEMHTPDAVLYPGFLSDSSTSTTSITGA